MINQEVDVAIIGGGPAGLAAAVSAKENGANQVLILDRNSWFGGILPQCIHDGFGVEETGESMTGPEYAEKYIDLVEQNDIMTMNETMVLRLGEDREIVAVNKKGLYKIKANAIVLSMGCREKTRWNAMIPGDRPSGIFTAGVAQSFINLYNLMPGKNVVILGSGDVGLIMARRLKFEGANVLGVVELLPYTSGLPRNVVQCLDDYDIPLFLNHTITSIMGRERLEQVTIAQVDENLKPILTTEKKIKCDALLLSLGLIPENELSKNAGIQIDELTGGPIVDESFHTTKDGFFACGNCLQVYDTVDILVKDAKRAGKYAAKMVVHDNRYITVKPGNGIRNVIPQRIGKSGKIYFSFRVQTPCESPTLRVISRNKELLKKKLPWANPANMVEFNVNIPEEVIKSNNSLEVLLND